MNLSNKTSVKKYKQIASKNLELNDKHKSSTYNAFEKHDRFLIAMDKLNRLKLSKSQKDDELEKKEKGFTVYVNGANALSKKEFIPKHSHTTNKQCFTPRNLKTAFQNSTIEESGLLNRAKSAPGRRRKYWGQGSIEIKESCGTIHKLSMPVNDYSEDFEVDLDSDEDSIEELICEYSDDDYSSISDDISSNNSSIKEIYERKLDALHLQYDKNLTFIPKSPLSKSKSFSTNDLSFKETNQIINASFQPQRVHNPVPTPSSLPKTDKKFQKTVDSLNYFNRSQLGRLSSNIPNHYMDQQLLEMKNREQSVKEESVKKDDDKIKSKLEHSNDLTIPMLPVGTRLVFNVHSTWGDLYYVGLNGIEIFTKDGSSAEILDINADPPDINILDEYSSDPRTFTNLINGINQTCDDVNMWLVPYTHGKPHLIYITLCRPTTIAMIRIWNYNKSRIHSQRGAREISIHLDEVMIFSGEICKANGTVTEDMNDFGDNILFTVDEDILQNISDNDPFFKDKTSTYEYNDTFSPYERPLTGKNQQSVCQRPFTATNVSSSPVSRIYCTKCIELRLFSSWNRSNQIGLTGIIALNENSNPVTTSCTIETSLTDSTSNLDLLINDRNITNDYNQMCLLCLPPNAEFISIKITFIQAIQLSGLRIYNYNASYEDTYLGAKEIEIYLDGKKPQEFSKRQILRRAPGNVHYDYAQDLMIGCVEPTTNQFNLKYITLSDDKIDLPRGFVFKLELLDTWGDNYYIGLNGIELFDEYGKLIKLSDKEITAFPSSVNILGPTVADVRTPDKLVDGINNCNSGQHCWLAPFLPGQINFVYIVFDRPVTVSNVHIWNYSKSPLRGAKNFTLFLDDLLICNGILSSAGNQQPNMIILGQNRFEMDYNEPMRFNNTQSKLTNNQIKPERYQIDQSYRPLTSIPSNNS